MALVATSVCSVIAAALGGSTVASGLAVGATALLIILRVRQRSSHVERRWREARAAAEEIRSLTWRYVAGVRPFASVDMAANGVVLVDHLGSTVTALSVVPAGVADEPFAATSSMAELRAQPLGARVEAYTDGRVKAQQRWYAQRQLRYERTAARWDTAFFAFAGVGLIGAGAAVIGDAINVAGLASTSMAAILSWQAVRQHAALAQSYARAASRLAQLCGRVGHLDLASGWGDFVDDAEGVIAAEHREWLTSRS